jgi:hypothetical protein
MGDLKDIKPGGASVDTGDPIGTIAVPDPAVLK